MALKIPKGPQMPKSLRRQQKSLAQPKRHPESTCLLQKSNKCHERRNWGLNHSSKMEAALSYRAKSKGH